MHLVLQRGNHTASKVEEMVDWKALFYLCQKYQIQLSLRNIENFRKLISQKRKNDEFTYFHYTGQVEMDTLKKDKSYGWRILPPLFSKVGIQEL